MLEVGDGSGANFAKLLAGYRDGRSYIRRPDDLQAWVVGNGVLPPLQRAMRWLDLDVAPGNLDGRLARYKHPRDVVLADALPRTALGKVKREELKRLARHEHVAGPA